GSLLPGGSVGCRREGGGISDRLSRSGNRPAPSQPGPVGGAGRGAHLFGGGGFRGADWRRGDRPGEGADGSGESVAKGRRGDSGGRRPPVEPGAGSVSPGTQKGRQPGRVRGSGPGGVAGGDGT